MAIIEIFAIAIGLALDAAAVSIGAAAGGFADNRRAVFRLAFHFGLFQAFMPFIGWLLGVQLAGWFAAWDHWIAFVLLSFVGGRMIRSGFDASDDFQRDPSRGSMLVLLSFATSVDALAVGFSLAMLNVQILLPCLVIGFVTAGLSLGGIRIGSSLSGRFGKRMEIFGGFLLLAIGLRILVTHLLE
ncbi:MAG: manganese efflux pump [Gemmatimonadetes bacterium]|jgi:putative Mn2+ efflux pump MntP|nr:manganese efflux pump [Gemmatimonadota bacterium]